MSLRARGGAGGCPLVFGLQVVAGSSATTHAAPGGRHAMSSKDNLKAGDVVDGRFRITEILGHGGFAYIYVAERLSDGAEVVVKMLHHLAAQQDSTAFERFRREATIAAGLVHPNIVRTVDYGRTDQGKLFLVMERIPGRPLDEVMKAEGALPLDAVGWILEQLLGALSTAHGMGIVHRDLKPTNILLVGEADRGQIKVIDFGLAKVLEGTDPSVMETLTKMGTIVGTPGYLAPEVLFGDPVTPAADIYASGVIGHELCMGRLAYTGKALERVQAQARRNPDPPPAEVRSHPVYQVIERLMARELDQRYPSADQALTDLQAIARRSAETASGVISVADDDGARPTPKRWWKFWK